MTDSIRGIGGVKEAGRNGSQGGGAFKREKGRICRNEQEDDRIDISKEASEKALEERCENGF